MQPPIEDLAADVTRAVGSFSLSAACTFDAAFYVWMRVARFEETVRHWRDAPTPKLKAEYAALARKRARTVLNRIKAETSASP